MPSPSESVKVATRSARWSALLIATLLVWLLRGYLWPGLSNVEVDTLRAMIDPTLFHRDYSVQESLHFGPRFYYNRLVLLPVQAGMPLAWAFAFWHVVALGALLSGLRALAHHAGMGEKGTAVFVLWLLTTSVGTLGATYFYTHAPVPAVWAIAVAVWGLALAWRGRWLAAFVCCGAAALLQFLVGFYAGALALTALLWLGRGRKLTATLPWLAGLALVYGPMAATGGTGGATLTGADFVQVYAQIRLPHHILPSAWGSAVWVQTLAFYSGAWFFLHRTRQGRPTREYLLFLAVLGMTALALILNYLLVEIFPLPLMAKLQPARLTAFTQGLTLLLLATRLEPRFTRDHWPASFALGFIPFTVLPGALLLLAGVLWPEKSTRRPWAAWVLLFATILALQPFAASFAPRVARYGLWILIVGAQLFAFGLMLRPRWLAVMTVLVTGGAVTAAALSGTTRWPARLAGHFCIDMPPWTAPGSLGLRFGQQSHPDALVLVPPTGDTWPFKLYSRRAVVVDDKSTPFTDRGMREWRDRMSWILGEPLKSDTDCLAVWTKRTPEDIAATAAHYGARYILTRDDSHSELPGVPIDHENGWTMWQLPPAEVAPLPR